VIAEGTGLVVVLAVHVVGDGAAHRDEARSRQHRQAPAARHEDVLDVAQRGAGFASQPAGRRVEADEAVEARGAPPGAARVEAGIAVGAAQSIGDAGTALRQLGCDPAAVVELDHLVRQRRQPAPGRYRSHEAATRNTKRLSRWYFAQ